MHQETQTNSKTQTSTFYFPRLSEYAEAFSRIMRELKNIGASPGEIIGLLKGTPDPPDSDGAGITATIPDADLKIYVPSANAVPAAPVATAATVQAAPARKMFTAQKIARALGIYSMYGLPHAHAVSAIIKYNLYLDDGHMEERILFRTSEFTVYYTLYDAYAAVAIRNWLENNGYPYEVDSYYYTYHVRYTR